MTKTVVNRIEPGRGDRFAWDSDLPGFGIKVTPAGRRVYLCRYRLRRRPGKFTIGTADRLTPDAARAIARAVFADVAAGVDPMAARRDREAQAVTVAAFAEIYMTRHARVHKKPRSAANDRRLWDLHILPRIGPRPLLSVTRADVIRLHADMGDKPNSNRALALLSKAFNLAEAWELRPLNSNPCRHVPRFAEGRHERTLTPDEIPRLGRALDWYARRGRSQACMAALVRLLLLTGARVNELRLASADQYDAVAQTLRLPDTKTGPDVLYLSDIESVIIEGIKRAPNNPYLIPGGTHGRPLSALYRRWKTILKNATITGRVRLHDLRHTNGSFGHSHAGLTQRQVASVLRHRQLSTTERYIHDGARREASARVSAVMAGLLNDNPSPGRAVSAGRKRGRGR